MAENPRVLQRMRAGGLLDKGGISIRARELVMLAGLYHGVSFMINAAGVEHEACPGDFPFRFPAAPSRGGHDFWLRR